MVRRGETQQCATAQNRIDHADGPALAQRRLVAP
jgi:hypothetical protein